MRSVIRLGVEVECAFRVEREDCHVALLRQGYAGLLAMTGLGFWVV